MEECIICFEETDQFIKFNCCDHKTCSICYPLIIEYTNKCTICQRDIIIYNHQPQFLNLYNQIQRDITICKMGCIIFTTIIIVFYIIKYKL